MTSPRIVPLAFCLVACAGGAGAVKEPIGETRRPTPRETTSTTPTSAPTPGKESLEERAARLHKEAIIVDGHNDIPSVLYASNVDIATRQQRTHTDIPRLKAGGTTALFFSIYVEADLAEKPTITGGGAARHALDLIDVTYRTVEKNSKDLVLATSAADIRKAKREGKVAVLMGIEGGHAIENSLGALRDFYRLGCRYMTLTHTNSNEWADSAGFSGPPPVRHRGLTSFGEEVVKEMQRIGMLVDVSHTSDDTFNAVLRVAQAPVIASHSSARALADHRRNLSDDMLKALAKNGGIAMVNFWAMFLSNDYAQASKKWFEKNGKAFTELRAKYKEDALGFRDALEKLKAETEPFPKVPLSTLVDHIDHMVKVAGVDHVGLGSDFDGVDTLPEGLDGVDGLPKITLELVRRGYKDEDILKILGGNFLRVFEKVELYARNGKTVSGDGSLRRLTDK